jgi:hypothetical protein
MRSFWPFTVCSLRLSAVPVRRELFSGTPVKASMQAGTNALPCHPTPLAVSARLMPVKASTKPASSAASR